MPFVLDGEEGRVDIVGDGTLNEITFAVDRIAQQPMAEVARSGNTGSFVRVHWPLGTSCEDEDEDSILTSRVSSIRSLVAMFGFLNPHLGLRFDGPDDSFSSAATDPDWRKGTLSSPTSPHWYEPEHLERLIGAYITHDRLRGNRDRTAREFVSEFKGLTSTVKQQKAVLAEVDLARAPLAALVADDRDIDHALAARLLTAMKAHTTPVRPSLLGMIGKEHIKQRFEQVGILPNSFEYKKVESLDADGLPQVTEVAFAARGDAEDEGRILVTGINWSPDGSTRSEPSAGTDCRLTRSSLTAGSA